MKIVIAVDSFKGSLTSLEAGQAIADGIRRVKDADIKIVPIADGGEGTVTALVNGMGGRLMKTTVTGPLGSPVEAEWGIVNGDTAVIEMASAAGICLVEKEQLDPLRATTFGVGELIKTALDMGLRRFIIGIGGSATNDGGSGMLEALGFELNDSANNKISRGAIGLKDLSSISSNNVTSALSSATFRIVCDVSNPLCGDMGCSKIYGPQKGASPSDIEAMDGWLKNFALLSGGDPDYPGAGAAGGMGFAFKTFLGGSLERGIDIIIAETRLEALIKDADLVITGEGRMDSQTINGKVPFGIASISRKCDRKLIAFCGCCTPDSSILNSRGIAAIFPILREVVPLNEALSHDTAYHNLASTAEQAMRLMALKVDTD